MIPKSRLQFTAPVTLRHRKPASEKLKALALSGKMIMRLAAKGCYPPDEPLSDKQARNLRDRRDYKPDRKKYLRDYAKQRRLEQKQQTNKG